MGCAANTAGTKKEAPATIGGSLMQTPTAMSEEDVKRIIEQRNKDLEDGLLLLRKAGYPVDFCASSGKIKIIVEDYDITYDNGVISFRLDGEEKSQHFGIITVTLAKNQLPSVTTHWSSRLININEE